MPAAFDLAVIGAGIIGAWTAYYARSLRHDLDIVLIDRGMTGSGATFYSGGHMHPHGSSPAQRELAELSMRRYREIASAVPGCAFRATPLFAVVHRDRAEDALRGYLDQPIRAITGREASILATFFPGFHVDDDQVVLGGCVSAYGSPPAVAQSIVASLRRTPGFACWESVPIQRIEPLSSGFRLWSRQAVCTARQVVCCTGPWLPGGPHPASLPPLDVRVKKVAAMHIHQCPPSDAPILYLFDDDAYILPLHERGHWLLSFTAREWDCAPDARELGLTDSDETVAHELLQRYCPGFLTACHGGRVSADLYTRDRLPVTRALPAMPDYVLASGGSGFGYRLAPAIAELALRQLPGLVRSTCVTTS